MEQSAFETRIDLSIRGLDAYLFRKSPDEDRWSLCVGGFYNFFLPLDMALLEAERIMNDVVRRRVARQMSSVRRRIRRETEKIIVD